MKDSEFWIDVKEEMQQQAKINRKVQFSYSGVGHAITAVGRTNMLDTKEIFRYATAFATIFEPRSSSIIYWFPKTEEGDVIGAIEHMIQLALMSENENV